MKTKLLIFLLVTFLLSLFMVVSSSAFDIMQSSDVIKSVIPSRDQLDAVYEAFLYQTSLGYVDSRISLVAIGYDTDVNYMRATGVIGGIGDVSVSVAGSYATYSSSKTFYVYKWTGSGWVFEYTSSNKTLVCTRLMYSAIYVPAGNQPETDGFAYSKCGNGDLQAISVRDYFKSLYDIISNYESDILAAELKGRNEAKAECELTHNDILLQGREEGYENGYLIGQFDCEKSHDQIRNEGYDTGYQNGYSEGQESGIWLGEYECSKTHEAMKLESLQAGIRQGRTEGYATGYDEGYVDGDKEGYDRGYAIGKMEGSFDMGASDEELDAEYNRGYDKGYTDALNDGEILTDYVDGIFSAPIDFLYNAFNIEILGINLFNVFMLLISIIIVGGVMFLVFKFR